MADAKMDTAPAEATSPEALLELILSKEDEIKQRVRDAQTEADRLVEEAKLEASMIKRDAAAAEVGTDIKEKELAKAQAEAERLVEEIGRQADDIREKGSARMNDAVAMLIKSVLPPLE
jgi:vacuolar-type H+-ATPase subunit H